jgi:ATP-binding cassette subfamily G (WHITE) protein 2 (PDR)
MYKTVSQAMALAGVLILAIVIYTGFVIAAPQMRPWISSIRLINPVYNAFKICFEKKFYGRELACSSIVPSYQPRIGNSWNYSATR